MRGYKKWTDVAVLGTKVHQLLQSHFQNLIHNSHTYRFTWWRPNMVKLIRKLSTWAQSFKAGFLPGISPPASNLSLPNRSFPIVNLKPLNSGQFCRSGLQNGTFNRLDTLRARINTNSLFYEFDIKSTDPATLDTINYTLRLRIDLCSNIPNAAHGNVALPHAQVTWLRRAGANGNINVPQAYQLLDGPAPAPSEIEQVITQVNLPPTIMTWLIGQLVGMREFQGKQLAPLETRGRFAVNNQGQKRDLGVNIIDWNWDYVLPPWVWLLIILVTNEFVLYGIRVPSSWSFDINKGTTRSDHQCRQ